MEHSAIMAQKQQQRQSSPQPESQLNNSLPKLPAELTTVPASVRELEVDTSDLDDEFWRFERVALHDEELCRLVAEAVPQLTRFHWAGADVCERAYREIWHAALRLPPLEDGERLPKEGWSGKRVIHFDPDDAWAHWL